MRSAIHPCQNCKYFKACGNSNRTMPCDGRETKNGSGSNTKKSYVIMSGIDVDNSVDFVDK